MALTKVQERLIDGLKIFGVHRDQAVAMMVFMKDDEPGMLELISIWKTITQQLLICHSAKTISDCQ